MEAFLNIVKTVLYWTGVLSSLERLFSISTSKWKATRFENIKQSERMSSLSSVGAF